MVEKPVVGRFAPSPSGRLHLGNVLCALLAYLSAKSIGGKALLRIEDIDTARCTAQNTQMLIDDLHWLGFEWDGGEDPADFQSARTTLYAQQLERLREKGLLYPCYCTRAQLHAASAPHGSDGMPVYDGRCRKAMENGEAPPADRAPAWRLRVPQRQIIFRDGLQGVYSEQLDTDCGDFLLRRSDGIFAYQLAVVVDDALTGVTQVVRGRDLLGSTPRQLYLYKLLGYTPPDYYHIPLLLGADGSRLAKRDRALDIGALRQRFLSPEPLIGMLAYNCGILPRYMPISIEKLLPLFRWEVIKREDIHLCDCGLLSSV